MATAYPNEVGAHTPELQLRYVQNPVASWCGRFLEKNRRHPVPEFHLDLYDDVMSAERMVVKAMRSGAKTTVCVENFVTYLACEYPRLKSMANPPVHPHEKVLIISETGSKAEEILRHIKLELEENSNILAKYGELRPPGNSKKKWTDRLIQTRDGFEVKVGGRGCQIRGFRPTLVIIDDIEDDEEVRSDDQRAKLEEWVDKAVINTLDEIECQLFVVGTPLHPLCLLNYLEAKPGWKSRKYMAYRDGVEAAGHELWPSKWWHERLQKRKAEIGNRAFRAEYMCDPMVSESPIFVRVWFKPYQPAKITKYDKTLVSCDPAISKTQRADYTAITAASTMKGGPAQYYFRRGGVIRGKWGVERTVHELIKVYDLVGASGIIIETIAYQQALAEWLSKFLDEEHRTVPIICVTPDTDKERRAYEIQPMYSRGEVYFDFEDPQQQVLMDQLYLFPTGSHDDYVDSSGMLLDKLRDWRKITCKDSSGPTFMDEGKQFTDEQRQVYG